MRFLAILLIVFCSFGLAKGQSSKDNGQFLIDRFFEIYQSKGAEEASKFVFASNKWMSVESDEVKNMIFELTKTVNLVGNYIGYEELRSLPVTSRFRAVSYFVYYDRQPLRFTFQLYKNSEGWMFWNFRFDTSYDDEMDEFMKLSNKK
ncbi:MAG: hypothetical protein EAZ57_01230 [Cytophagales bacterium]|nr:MAG: hypothetical protein EAZ67_02045 [Cytophagales bacterium]TAF62072.1 MAG: hypothetical protein EAZ57_01230 [Cytophagales bacterium]